MAANSLNTLGRNITFQIYNGDGTPFEGLILHKSVVDSVVMSLGDKITGDVYYRDNTLAVTMSEYIEYKRNEDSEAVRFILVNPPTVVREGIVSDNSELHGMTKYSFVFYHPMCAVSNFPFTDVAVSSDEQKYLSNSKTFNWIGNLFDMVAKLNKNLQGTQWVVDTNIEHYEQDGVTETSMWQKAAKIPDEPLSFDKTYVSEVSKTSYETWEIPFIVDQIAPTDARYAQGKRFLILFGTPSNEILDDQDEPYIFRFGQGVGLKNNSRTPRNNKIITRIAGYGSENNIPFGYPQIQWFGDQTWKYTVNNDSSAEGSLPIYKGILGGEYVNLIKHPFTRKALMPSVYRETLFNKVSPYMPRAIDPREGVPVYSTDLNNLLASIDSHLSNPANTNEKMAYSGLRADVLKLAKKTITTPQTLSGNGEGYAWAVVFDLGNIAHGHAEYVADVAIEDEFEGLYLAITGTVIGRKIPNPDFDPTTELVDYYDAIATQEYPYTNEINPQAPSYENHEFVDIKPELDADRNIGIVGAVPLNADLTPADSWDDSMDDDGKYLQSYFQITLPQLSFDLYACAAITQEMQINMRSGACIGCTFSVQVDWDDYKSNFYDDDGNFVPDGEQRDLTKYPKSNLGQINVVVQKDNSTFGTLMPNIYQQPKANDLFVFIGISLPLSYIASAEERLDDAMKTYMLENNIYYFDYPLKFDEYFLATHTNILEQIHPNSVIHFMFGGVEQQLFVKQLTIKYGDSPLPQYDITLTDNIEVVLNQIGQTVEMVKTISGELDFMQRNVQTIQGDVERKSKRGNINRFYYYAQEWEDDDEIVYVVNQLQAPYFSYQDEYWIFNPSKNGAYSMHDMGEPKESANGILGWEKMTAEFKYIITKIIFGENAYLGSFIINDDWMISQHGTINGQESVNYTQFDPEHPNDNTGTNFIPNFAVDGLTGKTYQNDAVVRGTVYAESGYFNGSLRTTFHNIANDSGWFRCSSDDPRVQQGYGVGWNYLVGDYDNMCMVARKETSNNLHVRLPNTLSMIGRRIILYEMNQPPFSNGVSFFEISQLNRAAFVGVSAGGHQLVDFQSVYGVSLCGGVVEFLAVPHPTDATICTWVIINIGGCIWDYTTTQQIE